MIDKLRSWWDAAAQPRVVTRLLFVAGTLVLILVWRVDQAVSTAYTSGWLDLDDRPCGHCRRLPSNDWVWTQAGASVLAALLLSGAVLLWRTRHLNAMAEGEWDRLPRGGVSVIVVAALVGAAARFARASGYEADVVRAAVIVADVVVYASLGLMIILDAHVGGEQSNVLVARLGRFLRRQRMNVLAVVVLVLALDVIGQTSGQAIDSVRAWRPDTWDGVAALSFGVASAVLLSLVVYESAVRLGQFTTPATGRQVASWKFWFGLAAGIFVVWLILWGLSWIAYGLLAGAVVIAFLGVLELKFWPQPQQEMAVGANADPSHHGAEMLAIVPLLALASVAVAAAVDASLSEPGKDAWLPLAVPIAALGAAAVLMTSVAWAPPVERPPRAAWIVAVLLALGVMVGLTLGVHRESVAAVVGVLCVFAVGVYTWWAFRRRPLRIGADCGGAHASAFSFAAALGCGAAALVGVHLDPWGVGDAVGMFALVNVALALGLVGLHFLERANLLYRPPRLLATLGFRHLPLVILIVAWWALAAVGFPKETHDLQLVDRPQVATSVGRLWPQAPTLDEVFRRWVAAQPELAGGVSKDEAENDPVPLVLVAAHGGGIRAAYWTAAALDCIVGFSVERADLTALDTDDETARSRTCEDRPREPAERDRAARKIFLASGVSGGAVGIHAYALELTTREPFSGDWVDDRLGHDFASATVGWGLFHDLPNHFLGLRSKEGGACPDRDGFCFRQDRAAVLEETFDREGADERIEPLLRHAWDLRKSRDAGDRAIAETIPLIVNNSTAVGGNARAVISAADFGDWPGEPQYNTRYASDKRPLAGTVEALHSFCRNQDTRLSSASLLAARFPWVSPTGRIAGKCGTGRADRLCRGEQSSCTVSLVDGGYVDNSGLMTIVALWPSLRDMIVRHNRRGGRKIAPVIVELDNHYQATLKPPAIEGGGGGESLVPLFTALGGRRSSETYARARAFQLLPRSCVVTISPGLHPGLDRPARLGAVGRGKARSRRGLDPAAREIRRPGTLRAGLPAAKAPGLDRYGRHALARAHARPRHVRAVAGSQTVDVRRARVRARAVAACGSGRAPRRAAPRSGSSSCGASRGAAPRAASRAAPAASGRW